MNKTCYFCDGFSTCFSKNNNSENVVTDIAILCSAFSPNADWLEYEALKKENEELKKQNKKLLKNCNELQDSFYRVRDNDDIV